MSKTVAIIGAGPVGLAAAAHVLERGMTAIVLEAGHAAGAAVRQWGHVKIFSPWEYNIDKAAARLLEPIGWNPPNPHAYATGAVLIEHYIEVRSIAADIACDRAAAERVELELPETGVCTRGGVESGVAGAAACCGAPAMSTGCCGPRP